MKSIKRNQLRSAIYAILKEDYGPMQDPSVLFPGQTEELRAMNDELESKKQGDYASFVNYLKKNINDPKLQALLNSGHFDGSLGDDQVMIQEIDIPVTQLQPTQSEIGLKDSVEFAANNFPDRTAKLVAAPKGTTADVGGRIITADGRYIIDGHHRWSQVYIMNPDAKIPAFNIVTNDSAVPGQMTTKGGQDYLKLAQIAIAAVDGSVPQVSADTATDIYRTGGDKDTIRNMMKELVPQGSRFADALESELFNKDMTSGEMLASSAPEEVNVSGEMEKPPGPDIIKDESGKALNTSTSGDQQKVDMEDDRMTLNEIFAGGWINLSEQTMAAIGGSGYDQVINRLVDNAVSLYNGTAEEAKKMTSRSEMPQFDKGGTDVDNKLDALKSGHVDWNAPYDKSDIASGGSGDVNRDDIQINENKIRQLIRNSIKKHLTS